MEAFGDLLEDRAIQMALEGNERCYEIATGVQTQEIREKSGSWRTRRRPCAASIADLARGLCMSRARGSSGESDEG